MKNKYVSYKEYNQYVDVNYYLNQYNDYNWSEYKTETEDERLGEMEYRVSIRLAREKAEKRNDKIDQILG
jgi:hypothetical protein